MLTTIVVGVLVILTACALVFLIVRPRRSMGNQLSAQMLDLEALPPEVLKQAEPLQPVQRQQLPKATTKLSHLPDPAKRKDRVTLVQPVRINRDFTGITREIGVGGMSLGTDANLTVAQPIQLSFALPTGQPVNIAGVVWWRKERTIGVRFDVYDKQTIVIRRWIEQHHAQLQNSGAPQA